MHGPVLTAKGAARERQRLRERVPDGAAGRGENRGAATGLRSPGGARRGACWDCSPMLGVLRDQQEQGRTAGLQVPEGCAAPPRLLGNRDVGTRSPVIQAGRLPRSLASWAGWLGQQPAHLSYMHRIEKRTSGVCFSSSPAFVSEQCPHRCSGPDAGSGFLRSGIEARQ